MVSLLTLVNCFSFLVIDSTQCSWPSVVRNAKMEILQGYKIFEDAREGTVLQVKCNPGYRNERSPCEDSVNLTCVEGEWKGGIPSCGKFIVYCEF